MFCVPVDAGGDDTPGVDMSPGGGGGGDATPTVGTSPAKAETDRAQVRINAIPNRFMEFLLFENYQKFGIARYQKSGTTQIQWVICGELNYWQARLFSLYT